MDEQVIAAMARWPDVPAVYGWLSLAESGQWRLHPDGDALRNPQSSGEEITSPQVLAFMNRNYDADELGQWYFQNGPQRVYVRLDTAPYIAYTTVDTASGRLKLRTHTGLDIRAVHSLHLDDSGRLYASTDRGAVLVAGRDLPALLDALQDAGAHDAWLRCLETGAAFSLRADNIQGFPATAIPVGRSPHDSLPAELGFRRLPQPAPSPGTTPTQTDGPASG